MSLLLSLNEGGVTNYMTKAEALMRSGRVLTKEERNYGQVNRDTRQTAKGNPIADRFRSAKRFQLSRRRTLSAGPGDRVYGPALFGYGDEYDDGADAEA